MNAFITPEQLSMGNELLQWARDYLMAEDDRINRPHGGNVVCPFVAQSVRKNAFFFTFHPEINGEQVETICELTNQYIGPFHLSQPYRDNEQINKALLIVFPNIAEKHLSVLDKAHAVSKPKAVENGVMIGQFHPKCKTAAIHNPTWKAVSQSPYPLIAMRAMAIHDILFLGDSEPGFLHYHARFGKQFIDPSKVGAANQHLVPLYDAARKKYFG